jgi:endonuclease YncB( thermonuclease family)
MKQSRRTKVFGVKEIALLFGGAVVLGSSVGAGMHFWSSRASSGDGGATTEGRTRFTFCGGTRDTNCVVDGDTIRVNGDKIRLVGFNTPEISNVACAAEAAKGEQAKLRLLALLNSGKRSFAATADMDRDRYGRLLRQVKIDGSDVADTLIAEGLAEPYQGGQKRNWCQ